MHQALLCPIIAKLFGYIFTPAPLASSDSSSLQIPSSKKIAEHVSAKSVLSQREFKDQMEMATDQVENRNHSTFDDTNNRLMNQHTKVNTLFGTENHANSINGKQMENGCDIGNNLFGDASIPCPSDSNKKMH